MVYVLMAVAMFSLAGWTVLQRRDPALAATFFCAGGAIIQADWVAHGWFMIYLYHPGLFRDPVADSTIGEVLADPIFVACLSVMLCAYLPVWLTALLGTGIVTGLEALFLRLGLFSHHGWQTWLTALLFPIYFAGVAAFCQAARSRGVLDPWIRRLTWAGLASVFDITIKVLFKVSNALVVHIRLLPTTAGNLSLGLFVLYALFTFPVSYWLLSLSERRGWTHFVVVGLIHLQVILILNSLHFLSFRPPWGPVTITLCLVAGLYVACLADNWIVRLARPNPPARVY